MSSAPPATIRSRDECSILPRSFYARSSLDVAKDLLGKYLVHFSPEGLTCGMIVETEAYLGVQDKASHSYGGRRTARNEVMYGEAGHAYVYQIYGIYYCMNVVTGAVGVPQGVFIRALQPLLGLELMARRRGLPLDGKNIKRLTNGPSKACMAMGIDRRLNGSDLVELPLRLTRGKDGPFSIVSTPRMNVDYAEEDSLLPYRFLIEGNEYVSR